MATRKKLRKLIILQFAMILNLRDKRDKLVVDVKDSAQQLLNFSISMKLKRHLKAYNNVFLREGGKSVQKLGCYIKRVPGAFENISFNSTMHWVVIRKKVDSSTVIEKKSFQAILKPEHVTCFMKKDPSNYKS
ncbi:CLUMA_CG004676, isoform A [Clunio marinus]|uniref:CLUMA_CG004676, isoform A n=1 Tax=Clunio marinus TaxID=568069 RepID=A0A1J1HUE4_9DIPT|nr:CLUMA_CG004676, isoform A [Clunio marinus]